MADYKHVTVKVPVQIIDQVDSHLEYGDSRSEWVREAIRQRLGDINQPENDVADNQTSPATTN